MTSTKTVLTHKEKLILKGQICLYCGRNTRKQDSSVIYGTSYGPIRRCVPCDAYVGYNKKTNKPLGSVANAELRELRKQTHFLFDQIWQKNLIYQIGAPNPNLSARKNAYHWLARQLEIDIYYCHIGMFTTEQCMQVVDICISEYQIIGYDPGMMPMPKSRSRLPTYITQKL